MDYRNVKYLDPKNDLTFRKIFGQHPNIMRSFLNSLLPLEEGQEIEQVIYQDPALFPVIPELKHSVVDVKCTDNKGRQFIVEMQMYWTSAFKQRMLFNSGKAYVKQIDKGHKYSELLPVYGLSLVNDIFLTAKEYKNKYYHHYRLAHQELPNEIIEGIELIFIELPKFTPKTYTDKKMRNLWLRFLTEIDENTRNVDRTLYSEKEIKNALDQLQVSAFTKEELDYYDDYWDKIRVEKAAIEDAVKKMKEAQRKEEEAKRKEEEAKRKEEEAKRKEEEAKRKEEEARRKEEEARKNEKEALKKVELTQERNKNIIKKLAKKMKKYGESIDEIIKETGLSREEIDKL